jgi:hypothetical protein
MLLFILPRIRFKTIINRRNRYDILTSIGCQHSGSLTTSHSQTKRAKIFFLHLSNSFVLFFHFIIFCYTPELCICRLISSNSFLRFDVLDGSTDATLPYLFRLNVNTSKSIKMFSLGPRIM